MVTVACPEQALHTHRRAAIRICIYPNQECQYEVTAVFESVALMRIVVAVEKTRRRIMESAINKPTLASTPVSVEQSSLSHPRRPVF